MTWNDLGTVTPPELGIWYPFPTPITGPSRPVVKVACTQVKPSDRFLSFVWFRLKFIDPDTAENLYTPSFRIYPSPDPQIRTLDTPALLRTVNNGQWRPEIQKLITRRALSGTTREPQWGIDLSWWDSEAADASPLSVTWRVEDLQAFGYSAELLIYNAGSEPIENWAIEFEADDQITNTWGADLDAAGANTWTVSPSVTSGSPIIYPGETRIVGLVAEGDSPPSLRNLRVTSASPGGWDDGPDTPLFFDGGEY